MQAEVFTMEANKTADVDEHEQAATTYAEKYLDVVQNLPNDLQRVISQVRELDTRTCMELREYDVRHKAYVKDLASGNSTSRTRTHVALRHSLVRERELGDEKLQLANQLVDMVENAARMLKEDLQHLESVQTDPDYSMTNGSGGSYATRHDYQNAHSSEPLPHHGGGSGGHHAGAAATAASATVASGGHHHHHPHAVTGGHQPFHAQAHAASHASAGGASNVTSSATAAYHHRGDERASSGANGPAPKRRKSTKNKSTTDHHGSGGDGGASSSSSVAAAMAGHHHKDSSAAGTGRPDKRRRKDKPGSKRGSSGGGERDRSAAGGGGVLQKNALASAAAMAAAAAPLAQQKMQATTIPPDTIIDPNEPTYCVCRQVSFGEMIGCDNPTCVIEWFHFACVSLASKPKGKWYCPNCRRDHNRADQAKLSSDKSARGR